MANEQIVIGTCVALLCGAGVVRTDWFLANTRKGQRLVSLLGGRNAFWLTRLLLVIGAVFGALLAANVIHPLHW